MAFSENQIPVRLNLAALFRLPREYRKENNGTVIDEVLYFGFYFLLRQTVEAVFRPSTM